MLLQRLSLIAFHHLPHALQIRRLQDDLQAQWHLAKQVGVQLQNNVLNLDGLLQLQQLQPVEFDLRLDGGSGNVRKLVNGCD